MTVPLAVSKGRAGFGPSLSLTYDSGRGNGPFGFGWGSGLPAVSRRTDKGLPRYRADDVFVMSDTEDLVPVPSPVPANVYPADYHVECFRPRIEGLFARIERWTRLSDGDVHWRSISRENVTTVYGADDTARIADPADPGRVFSWLISTSADALGNEIAYEYAVEDGRGVDVTRAHERHRGPAERSAQRYIKRIRYGNRVSRLAGPPPANPRWLFEVVFDYGDHHPDTPTPAADRDWTVRADPFSSYRAGFEIRTYRVCRRVLMFHHFPDEPGVGADCLVRATELSYTPDPAAGTFLTTVTTRGYRRAGDGYVSKAMPPVEFEYSAPLLNDEVSEVDAESLRGLPAGLSTTGCRWVDLDGEGLAGMLVTATGALYYKANLGSGRFDVPYQLPAVPSLAGTGPALVDLAGDGQLDLVAYSGPTPGFVERRPDGGWEPFRTFVSQPIRDWADPNLRFVDLDGDGLADILVAEDCGITWHQSLAEDGFGPAQRMIAPLREEDGPRLLFTTDGHTAVHLADMSGDGLLDLVRVRNGEVCYWPNQGNGVFGRRIVMDDSPRFGPDELFDARRVFFADVDGSGFTDIVYAGPGRVDLYRNRCGNGWTEATTLAGTPEGAELTVADLLGTGTACLVWSVSRPGEERRSLRYLDLFGGRKPHLLIRVVNNLGAQTTVTYAPSTQYYLADKAAGQPWQVRLPFPVPVVSTVETRDLVAHNRFVTRYAYHHGFFDGVEREFRGFGMVEQWDSGQIEAVAGVPVDDRPTTPPALTRTWYHTGAFAPDVNALTTRYASEYWPGDPQLRLPDTVWPAGSVAADDLREACRALKGRMLRQEVYAEDGSAAADMPYSVTERNYTVELLQPKGSRAHAVCFARPRETLNLHYERRRYAVEVNGVPGMVTDPRITHELVFSVDEFGNVLRSATVAYGRRYPEADLDPSLDAATRAAIAADQSGVRITLKDAAYTNPVETATDHRTPMPAQTRSYELVHAVPTSGRVFGLDELLGYADAAGDGAHDLPYEDVEAAGAATPAAYRRLLEHTRVRYRRDDLTGPLAPGELMALGLVHESYRLAFTPGLIGAVYRRQGANLLPQQAVVLGLEAGHAYADGCWWIPSGELRYSPGGADTPAQELAYARNHFFTVTRHIDPFGSVGIARYDDYDLLLLDTRDPVGNRVSAGERAAAATPAAEPLTPALDYRVLAPRVVSDANRNRTEVRYDALGLVTATARRGKPEEVAGDDLSGLDPDVSDQALAGYLADPSANAGALLGGASTRVLVDLFAYHRTRTDPRPAPVVTALLQRESHGPDPVRIHHRLTYSDGFGRDIQIKAQAEPDQSGPRWVGSGWVVFNDKGLPVRRYEPFFSATHAFEFAVTAGVSPVICYDPIGREVAVLTPDGSYTKVLFDPWRHEVWDANDTLLLDPRTDPHVRAHLAAYFATQPQAWQTWYQRRISGALGTREQRAAADAAVHAATPGAGYADVLGRTTVTVAHNRYRQPGTNAVVEEWLPVRETFDIEGAKRLTVDPRGVRVLQTAFDVAGRAIATRSPDTGEHWFVPDVAGMPVRRWDGRGFDARHRYDAARRPTELWITGPDDAVERLVALTVYGDDDPAGAADNVRGRPRWTFDGSGALLSRRHDFTGNLSTAHRQLAKVYDATPDWSALSGVPVSAVEVVAGPLLEPEKLTTGTEYDALNRPVAQALPDATVLLSGYNDAGLLETVSARLSGAGTETPYLTGAAYDAHGRMTRIEFANGTVTAYGFDPLTFRVRSATTARGADALQDMSYVYDPVGNIVDVADGAQQTLFFAGQVTGAGGQYVFDALYRLIEATGREHASLGVQPDGADPARRPIPHPNDAQAVRGYTERYRYDGAGNILSMAHVAGAGSWTRDYTYAPDSNRLVSHTLPGAPGTVSFGHDANGNMDAMAHLGPIGYDHHDQMISAGLGGGGTAYYAYDGGGERRRRVIRRLGGVVEEIISLPVYEIYRKRVNGQVAFERRTVHIADSDRRYVLVETTTLDTADPQRVGDVRTRFQLHDVVSSARIEVDASAAVISYEEYHPYGTTSMWLATSAVEVSPKRYRYTGKERDEETGLSYHGARYYIPWLGRWTSYDPQAHRPGESTYMYVRGNPIRFHDPDGADCREGQEQKTPWLAWLGPATTGWAVRPQVNPCLRDHPGWQQWQAEEQRKASIAIAGGTHTGVAIASALVGAGVILSVGGYALGSLAMSSTEAAAFWALTNPSKAAVVSLLAQFGIGLVDPHPPGMSPLDADPIIGVGHLTGAEVRTLAQVHSTEEVVKISVRSMSRQQLMHAVGEAWAMDKVPGGAVWRGTVLEGALAATRYKFFEWVGRLRGGYFRTFDFYTKEVGIQVKTLNAVPNVSTYKGFIDELAAAKKAGVMDDGRRLVAVELDIATPAGFTGPAGKAAEYADAIKQIKQYGASKQVNVTVYGVTETEMNLVVPGAAAK